MFTLATKYIHIWGAVWINSKVLQDLLLLLHSPNQKKNLQLEDSFPKWESVVLLAYIYLTLNRYFLPNIHP